METGERPALRPRQAAPVAPPPFRAVRAGSIRPQGRWKRSLEVIADGWLRRIVEQKHGCYYPVFWARNTFDGTMGDVHSEWAGYTADAIVRLSSLLPESWIAGQKPAWLENVIASQDPDGYLGCNRPETRWKHGFELWCQDRMLQALLHEYEAAGDQRVLDACIRAARCITRNTDTDWFRGVYSRPHPLCGPRQAGHSVNIVHPLLALYEYSGDEALLEAAVELYRDFDQSASDISATAFLTQGMLRTHIVTVCEHLSIPAKIYAFTGDSRYLDASIRAYELLGHSLQVQGCPSGNEFTYGRGPRKYTEHCGVIEYAISCTRLLHQTGLVHFADAAERAMMNAYFGSKSPDGMTLCYNHAPNQVVAADWSGPYEDNWDQGMFRNHYAMNHDPRCCNANTSRGFPNYVGYAAAAGADGSVAFVYYGPYTLVADMPGAGCVRFDQHTDYPFTDEVEIEVVPERAARFPVRLRVPCWCSSAEIAVNGAAVDREVFPGRFATLDRTWQRGDTIRLRFEIPVRLEAYRGSWHSAPGFAVLRGPLTYTLPLDEQWVYVGREPAGPTNLDEAWNVVPGEGSAWNVALDLGRKRLEDNFERVDLPVPAGALPWQHPPVGLKTRARLLPSWRTDTVNGKPQTPALPPPPLEPEGGPREITLVPYGFTHIRMTYLPVLGIERPEDKLGDEGKAAQ